MSSVRGFTALMLMFVATIFIVSGAAGESAEAPPLQLEAKSMLGDVRGRIDHMAVDLAGNACLSRRWATAALLWST